MVSSPADIPAARDALARQAVGDIIVDQHNRRLTAPVGGGAESLMSTLRQLDNDGVRLLDVALRRPTLDDVFLALTGHVAKAEPELNREPVPVGAATAPEMSR